LAVSGSARFLAGGFVVLLLAALAVVFWPHPAAGQGRFACQVASVHDGDTLRCADGRAVRIEAIAAREMDGNRCARGHPCPAASAVAARTALRRLTMGRQLDCLALGRHGARTVGRCALPDGRDLSCAMIATRTVLRWPRHDREGRLIRC
jgi:endonuclease YncB( thermonuclease family)